MTNIAGLLKSEITRLSKKTAKQSVEPLRKAIAVHRQQIAVLRQQVAELQRQLGVLQRQVGKAPPVVTTQVTEGKNLRFVAKGFKKLRAKLGLSAREMGLLLQVSEQSVYNWENGEALPRPTQLSRIAALRRIGKREAKARLAELEAGVA